MRCKIADLITEIPEAGGMAPRCQGYLVADDLVADIVIKEEHYNWSGSGFPLSRLAYMESARQFYSKLLFFNGFYLHSSAICLDNRAYLFSGESGVGKSTHTRLWKQIFGENAVVFNDDKPALRRLDGCWYAYGTPWCGKDGINQNKKVPLAGICFLKQSSDNAIRRLTVKDSIGRIIDQTIFQFNACHVDMLDLMLSHVGKLVQEIPIFELENRPETEAAMLSFHTMTKAAEEAGL